MRSVPGAMMWEMFSQGKWQLLGGALGANLFTVLILAALWNEGGGAINPLDPSLIVMHVVTIQVNMFIFATAVFWAQGDPSRLFTKPITTASIVHWHMLPVMVLTATESIISTVALNAVFHLQWPIWGPAVFVAVLAAAIQASFWLTNKSGWIIAGLTIVAGVLGIWFKSRYGAPFSPPTHYWSLIEPGDAATLAVFTALAYGTAIVALARNRRGEPVLSLGIVAWFNRLPERMPATTQVFQTPLRAQFWFEWQQKGWWMPFVVVVGMVFGVVAWLLFSRNPEDLFGGFIVGGGCLTIAGLVAGAATGNTGQANGSLEISPFLATRPVTTPDLARTILKMLATSVLLAWIIWVIGFVILYFVLKATGSLPGPEIWNNLGWWYFPATLFGPWIVSALLTSLSLVGRSRLVMQLFCSGLAVAIALPVISRFALTEQQRLGLAQGIAICGGVAFLLLTVAAFVAALRRTLIGWSTVSTAVGAAIAIMTLVTAACMQQSEVATSFYVLLIGVACLAVAPLAAAPLALEWNRNR